MRSREVVKRPTPFVERLAGGHGLAGLASIAVYVSLGAACRQDGAQNGDGGSIADLAITPATSRADDEVK
jgi:hypothetical protein